MNGAGIGEASSALLAAEPPSSSATERATALLLFGWDAGACAVVAAAWSAVVWTSPFAGVPILALLGAPALLAALGAFAWTLPLLVRFTVPARRAIGGAAMLWLGGQITASCTVAVVSAAHTTALASSRGTAGWGDAALSLAPWLLLLLAPWVVLAVGLWLARGLRFGWALLAAALLVSVAPAAANALLLLAALGLPMSA